MTPEQFASKYLWREEKSASGTSRTLPEAHVDDLEALLRNERERCASMAEQESEPAGPIPIEYIAAVEELARIKGTTAMEELVRAAVRATASSIAKNIRAWPWK